MEPHPRTTRLPDTDSSPAASGAQAGRAAVDPSLAGTLLGGRYRIGECIGTGAMGVVWTAWDQRLQRTVAVKQLLGSAAAQHADPGDPAPAQVTRARTLREGRIAARVVHPRAIAVFDVVIPTGEYSAPWLVMEYLPSRSLAAVLAEHGPLEPGQVAAIGAQIADALAAVHAAGIVHGDVKPGNVLIGNDGSGILAKLTDFGVSRATWDTTATGGGMVAGTPGYVAPEVARGEDPTAASDVFSLGATLYAAVEGTLVCGDKPNHLAVLHAMAEGRLRPATRAGSMGRPLAAMLRVVPEHRPDMNGVRGALQERETGTPIPPSSRGAAVSGAPAGRETGGRDGAAAPEEEPAAPVIPADQVEPSGASKVTGAPGPDAADQEAADQDVADASDPNVADPNAADPNAADPNAADPNAADPNAADPNAADPNVADPNVADPNVADPNVADRGAVERSAPARVAAPRSDLGEPTRLSEPVDVPSPRRDGDEQARADRDRRPGGGARVLLVAGAAALALGLGAGVTVAGHSVFARIADTARHSVAAPQPRPVGPTPSAALAAPSSPGPSSAGPSSPAGTDTAMSATDVGQAVADYYGTLPADVDTAWSRLSAEARDESGGYDAYMRFWRTISDVSADNVQVDGTAATAQITFVTVDGRTSHETYRFEVRRGGDGRPQIESARRASAPM